MTERLREVLGDSVDLVISPLMQIVFDGTLPDLSGGEVLIFTSRHGVEGFCRLSDRRDHACYAVGDATAAAVRAAGMRAISAGGDAEALLTRIAEDETQGPFLHVRGVHVAADVAGALRAAGHDAQDAMVYNQVEDRLSTAARAVLAGEGPVLVPLMSPRSARIFFDQAGRITARLCIAAISRKVAAAVPEGAAMGIEIAQTPDLSGILTVLQEQVRAAKRLEGGKRAQ